MNTDRIAAITLELSSFVPMERGKMLRLELLDLGRKYKPRHTKAAHYRFIRSNAGWFQIRENGAQDSNHPYVYSLFTIPSQHVMGNSLEECLDNAIDESARRKK